MQRERPNAWAEPGPDGSETRRGSDPQPPAPIAVVGMACRFPGAPDVPSFWRLLEAGGNSVIEGVPGSGVGRVGELFPDPSVETEACRFGAYLEGLDRFDAPFFRISPVEAQLLDPQQRLMLEVSWQALEDAGIDPEQLRGSRTGVYAGISNYDYRGLILETQDTAEPAASLYAVTGTSFNTAIGRVAFALGLTGPAMALDTACSSSLVATHQAVSGLQRGEADLALAGGVHTILSGRLSELRGRAGMLAPDGQCKAFDASANGYVRGEGCGILVLKRLRDAEADGDRIWGVIQGSAVNQDGASAGLTVPSETSQQRVIEDALARAGVPPSEVDYLEAHGTGTEVGDPIELRAAAAAYGKGRGTDRPLLIGSVKTNVGHLEPAAGAAGLIKTLLAMRQGVIPKHLHFRTPNPELDWDRLPLRVTSEPTDWPLHPDRPPLAGVSGFGWSGTNAHVVVQGYDTPHDAGGVPAEPWPVGSARTITVSLPKPVEPERLTDGCLEARRARFLPLSGKSETALRELAGRYRDWMDQRAGDLAPAENGQALLSDLAWTAGTGRSHFGWRAGVVFRDAASLRDGLARLAEPEDDAAPGIAEEPPPKVAFVFTGQASQWVGMGEDLYASEPVVRAVLDRCDRLLREERGRSLLDAMFGRGPEPPDLDDPVWKQPAIYALECSLTALWSSLGITPAVVLGHSLGEIAAAQAAGVFSLEDGLRFAAVRGELIRALPGEGAMAAIFAPRPVVAAAVEEQNSRSPGPGLSVAADNGAHQAVSGPAAEVETLLARFEDQEVRVRRLRKSPAYHSAMLDPALDDLEAAFDEIPTAHPSLPFVSNLTGRVLDDGESLDGTYWRRQTRETVEFRRAVGTLAELGVGAVVEIGPHAVLGPMVSLAWPEPEGRGGGNGAPAVLSSLRRPSRETPEHVPDAFVAAAARAWEIGLPVAFSGFFAGESRRRIALPGYPFQRERHWIDRTRRRRSRASHPLLGTRHESASGEISFETEIAADDPSWLGDHRVFERLVAPGALYGAMAVAAGGAGKTESLEVADFQLHSPLILPEDDPESGAGVRKVQVVLDAASEGAARRVGVLSKGDDQAEWTLHAEAKATSDAPGGDTAPPPDLEALKAGLVSEDVAAYYRAKAGVGIALGPSFRTLKALWSGPGEALGEVALPSGIGQDGLEVHPLLLDGCFQILGAARRAEASETGVTYLPFGWERLWIAGPWPDRVVCHVRLREPDPDRSDAAADDAAEVRSADLRIYGADGAPLGTLSGYTIKRATRAALLSAEEGLDELLYEIEWRDQPRPGGILPADFLRTPAEVAADSPVFRSYLADEGVEAADEAKMQVELERLARSYALSTLERLGWERRAGVRVDAADLRQRLRVLGEHEHLFGRILELLGDAGVLRETAEGLVVAAGAGDPLPEGLPADPAEEATRLAGLYPHGANEIALLRRSAGALPEVLRGREDPLSLLFGDQTPRAGDLYTQAPVWRAANRMLGDVVEMIVAGLPEGRPLRVIEVGAGIGSATDCILPKLLPGRFEYAYTDISAGFFADAESRFSGEDTRIEYRVLDIEKDPVAQGFEHHGYDLAIAANVLHATRYLDETLNHCRELLAPSGQLIALENQRGRGWMDLIFGQLDGWWRFADTYRPRHALAGPGVWRRALRDTGFEEAEVVGVDESESGGLPDRGVIVASGPAEVTLRPGVWVVAADRGGVGAELAGELAARNQAVVLVDGESPAAEPAGDGANGVVRKSLETDRREAWRSLLSDPAGDLPLAGVVHLAGLDGRGPDATTGELAADVRHAAASALALVQGLADADATPSRGTWFITRGAQILERERTGQLAGAALWGFGRVVAREAGNLQPRMLDLDPAGAASSAKLAEELLFPDPETDVAYRGDRRLAARLVRTGSGAERLSLPEEPDWHLAPDEGGALEKLRVVPRPARPLASGEVRVAIEAGGLNFLDVFRAMGLVQGGLLGEEMCGRVLEAGSDVTGISVGDRVVGLAFGALGPEVITLGELVAPAPAGLPAAALATVPEVFVTAALSWELAGLKAGERVLVHAGAGGVGLAAIQLARAAGAEVFATASAPKRPYLRSLGVKHVFDSRRTTFSKDVLDATGGRGVEVVLNSLTGEGFIEASLACLATGGRFVELARRDILSDEDMAAIRPDVAYSILELDVLKEEEPARPGRALREVMGRIAAGELTPLVHTRWPLAEAGAAMAFMRDARHIGKIVLTEPPLREGRLRPDRTYLVTGGLGGIGCAVAGWLADRGARTVVLNGRREPDRAARDAIAALEDRGVTVRVELADVTDAGALDGMFARLDRELPPLAGVIHSVGALADAALSNQSWENLETVLWPKVVGAWHLHRATRDRDLEMFVLFSSVAGVLGNPGQSNHAAANAFLDQLAAHRRSLGLPGQAIAWGAWSEIGEAEEQRERIARRTEATGIEWITPEQGLRAFERLVREDVATSLVLARDWSVFEQPGEGRPPLLEDLLTREEAAGGPEPSEDLLTRLRQAPAAEHEPLLGSFLREQLQAVLRLPAPPAANVGFFDLGMDSLMAVEFRNRLNRAFSGEYTAPNTLVFDYPNVEALGGHLASELAGIAGETPAAAAPQPEPEPIQAAANEDDAIAIVGMACRFPGATDLDGFWRQLEAGAHAVTEGRPDAGPANGVPEGPAAAEGASRWGAFVEGIDRFDAKFFGVLPIAARTLDPQARLLLETSWHALEDAGMDPERLRGGRVGVYTGISAAEYRELMGAAGDPITYLGTFASMAVGSVAFRLGLTGPTMPVPLECASSLVAVHHAVTALRQGEADLALTGGVNAVFSRGLTAEMAALGMLSPTGSCNAFDAAADGAIRGEGCGMLVLKRLREAVADGDRIWGVVRGTAVNQNGATAGLAVPNGPAQEQVIEEALARAGVSPAEVDYLEAHGSGSELGDPIEVRAAAAVYGKGRDADRPLLIGSVKTNIGHLEAAAGIAGLIKSVLAMNRTVIPRHLHFRDPTPHLDWDRLPVQVVAETTDWPRPAHRPPRAGVSAFGVSGVNAHVVLEGYGTADASDAGPGETGWPAGPSHRVAVPLPAGFADPPADEHAGARTTRFLPLSGKSEAALRDAASRYLEWLEAHAGALQAADAMEPLLADMAWTAGMGRSHFGCRAGVVFRDPDSLREGLGALAAGSRDPGKTAGDAPLKVVFAFPGRAGGRLPMDEEFYASEPVARAVLNRCDEVFREGGRKSLLDVLFGRDRKAADPTAEGPANYALDCALFALWAGVGIRPQAAVGWDFGELAAAHAAGVFSLEDGLRLAAWSASADGPDGAVGGTPPEELELAPPSIPLISPRSGRALNAAEVTDAEYWRPRNRAAAGRGGVAPVLSALDAQLAVEIGPGDSREFAAAVARAYEAGVRIDFAGLFAGEQRRRIPLPGYPFQRRRFWIPEPRART